MCKKIIRVILFAFVIVLFFFVSNTYSASASTITINSFDEFKIHLTKKSKQVWINNSSSVLEYYYELEKNDYLLGQDIVIDQSDPFFTDSNNAFDYGIMHIISSINFNGNNKTITLSGKPKLFSLFGDIYSTTDSDLKISDLNIVYKNDVSGYPFARDIQNQSPTNLATAPKHIYLNNINVNLEAGVKPIKARGSICRSNYHVGSYIGLYSSGFVSTIHGADSSNINITVANNIGDESQKPVNNNELVCANGFAFDGGSFRWDISNSLHNSNNYSVLKEYSNVINCNINVGGSIIAKGYDTCYASGFAYFAGGLWLDNININVDGDIKAIMDGGAGGAITNSIATDITGVVMNLTNSTLSVNNLVCQRLNDGTNLKPILVCGIAYNNDIGNYTNIKNNIITIKNKIIATNQQNITCCIGFANAWNSSGSDGVNWSQFYSDNKFNVGSADVVVGKAGSTLQFYGFTYNFRTGINPIGSATIPKAELNNNTLKIGNININALGSTTYVMLAGYNTANASNNTIAAMDLSLVCKTATVCGWGHTQNTIPTRNVYEPLVSNNNVKINKIDVVAETLPYISCFIAFQDSNHTMRNNNTSVGSIKLNLTSKAASSSIIGGICGYTRAMVDSNTINIGDVDVEYADPSNAKYFGMGVCYSNGGTIQNNNVFIDKDIKIIGNDKVKNGIFSSDIRNSSVNNSFSQLDGKYIISDCMNKAVYFNATSSQINSSSCLMLSDYAPHIYMASDSNAIQISHYVPTASINGIRGLLQIGQGPILPSVANSTLLVEKPGETMSLFSEASVDVNNSINNTLLVANDDTQTQNRVAYATSIQGGEMLKQGDIIDGLTIAKRSFQDKYWNQSFAPYTIGAEENSFDYVIDKYNLNDLEGRTGSELLDLGLGVSRLGLKDYYNRHYLLLNLPQLRTYDILGIKSIISPTPTSTPVPTPSTPTNTPVATVSATPIATLHQL